MILDDLLRLGFPCGVFQPLVNAAPFVDDRLAGFVVLVVIDEELVEGEQLAEHIAVVFDMQRDDAVGLDGEPSGRAHVAAVGIGVFPVAALRVLEDLERAGVAEEIAEKPHDPRVGAADRVVFAAVQRGVHLARVVVRIGQQARDLAVVVLAAVAGVRLRRPPAAWHRGRGRRARRRSRMRPRAATACAARSCRPGRRRIRSDRGTRIPTKQPPAPGAVPRCCRRRGPPRGRAARYFASSLLSRFPSQHQAELGGDGVGEFLVGRFFILEDHRFEGWRCASRRPFVADVRELVRADFAVFHPRGADLFVRDPLGVGEHLQQVAAAQDFRCRNSGRRISPGARRDWSRRRTKCCVPCLRGRTHQAPARGKSAG